MSATSTRRRPQGRTSPATTISAIIFIVFLALAAGLFYLASNEASDSQTAHAGSSRDASLLVDPDGPDSAVTTEAVDPAHAAEVANANDPNDELNQRLLRTERDLAEAMGHSVPDRHHRFEMTGPAAITNTIYGSMPYALPLNPAGPQEYVVRWVEGWGYSPDQAESGTVYVLGHAWSQQPLAFNPISEVVTSSVDFSQLPEVINGTDGFPVDRYSTTALNGSVITMSDGAGMEKQWEVTNAFLVDKDEAIVDPDVIASEDPGKITLIACSVEGTGDLNYLVIVEGYLI